MTDQKLNNFLNQFPKTGNGKHTHIIYAPASAKGSFTIPHEKLNELYSLLSNSLFKTNKKISFVEKIQDTTRLVIDLDFKYKTKLSGRQYNNIILTKIIKNIFSNIHTLYNTSEEQRVCLIM